MRLLRLKSNPNRTVQVLLLAYHFDGLGADIAQDESPLGAVYSAMGDVRGHLARGKDQISLGRRFLAVGRTAKRRQPNDVNGTSL
jgi:hypothetical protein